VIPNEVLATRIEGEDFHVQINPISVLPIKGRCLTAAFLPPEEELTKQQQAELALVRDWVNANRPNFTLIDGY